MYQSLKKFLFLIFPRIFFLKFEENFRSFYSLLYRGDNYECTICETELRSFAVNQLGEKICPRCGSLPRNRRLISLLKKELKANEKVLEFSPSRSVNRYLKKRLGSNYLTTDFCDEFKADRKYDITAIPESDETFDTIIVYHVLEHIEDDSKAMRELYRVLKTGGNCWIQTPFKDGDILENFSIKSPEERERVFGQDDHVRVYSVKGLEERLNNAGFAVEVLSFTEETNNPHGFSEKEFVLKASKIR